jgi:hypothetical protein
MKKIWIVQIALISIFATPLTQASAAIKPGSACSKPGQIQQSGGTTYVCASTGKKSVWIAAGSTSTQSTKPTPKATAKATPKATTVTKTATPTPSPTNSCTTGVGLRLQTQIVNDNYGLATLEIKNPLKCTISYTITGQLTCNHYKQMRTPISGMSYGTLRPNETVRYYPQQAFQPAYQTCQQYQRASGAGPEYGAGILGFASYSYPATITGVSN